MEKQGYTNVGDVSPRINPRQLEGMTTRQLQKYAHDLNTFVSQRFQMLPSGEAVNMREVRAFKRDVANENRRRAEMRAALDRVDLPGAKSFEERQAMWRRIDPLTLEILPSERGTGSPIEELRFTQPPRTLEAFQRRREMMHAMSREPVAWRVARQRRSAVAMAQQTGNDRLAADLMRASTFQIQYLVERMDLLEQLSVIYTPADSLEAGQPTTRELMEEYDNGSYDQNVDRIAETVSRVIRTLK